MRKLWILAIMSALFVGCMEDTSQIQTSVEREINAYIANNPGILRHNEMLSLGEFSCGHRHNDGDLTGSMKVCFRSRRTGKENVVSFMFIHNANTGAIKIYPSNHVLLMGLNGGRY